MAPNPEIWLSFQASGDGFQEILMNIICAYPVNIDAVHNLRGEEISSLIQSGLCPDSKERAEGVGRQPG